MITVPFLTLLINLSVYSEINSNQEECKKALRTTVDILKQEEYRWRNIHNNPSNDEVEIIQNNGEIIVNVDIDTHVENIVNSRHIRRTYTKKLNNFDILPEYLQLYLCGNFSITHSPSPALMLGYKIPFTKLSNYGVGVSLAYPYASLNIYRDLSDFKMSNIVTGLFVTILSLQQDVGIFIGVRI